MLVLVYSITLQTQEVYTGKELSIIKQRVETKI